MRLTNEEFLVRKVRMEKLINLLISFHPCESMSFGVYKYSELLKKAKSSLDGELKRIKVKDKDDDR